jgi:hypothetical protein
MTIYVLTAYEFNHGSTSRTQQPLDERFLKSKYDYTYFVIDEKVPAVLKDKTCILEREIDQQLALAGKQHLGEWAFLLSEAKHAFCKYPFFMVSSRFYQKNNWLKFDLNHEWNNLFSYLKKYGWGYLPSYDRPLRWFSLDWEIKINNPKHFFPFTEKTIHLLQDLYQVKIPVQYSATADLFCNYIGFQTREHLLSYVNFYLPLIHVFFNEHYQPKVDITEYVYKTGHFQNEKPLTFILEIFSHLFFYKNEKKFFSLHYDSYYEVDEKNKFFRKLKPFSLPVSKRIERFFEWNWRKAKTEGCLVPLRPYVRKLKKIIC